MARLFRITESDLADLEQALPQISEALMLHLTPANRTTLRRCKHILSNVRWRYGPVVNVGTVPADDDAGDQDLTS